ncbi:MAG: DNA glycosylase [Clostridiales bacterium]|nr:DNA glycosylase [Clostridiales bacterium]
MYQIQVENFDIEKICYSGQCFRMRKNDRNAYEVVAFGKYLEVHQEGETITLSCTKEEYEQVWKTYLGLADSYDVVTNLVNDSDNYMKTAMEFGWGIRILGQDLWEMIISFLISQRNNIPRIKKCIETICENYGEAKVNEYGDTFYTFPTAEALANVSEEELKGCNLGYRAKYILKTSQMIVNGSFSLKEVRALNYKAARERLMELYGVGIKVAECICLYGLHHLDAFPVDTHINNVLNENYVDGFPFEHYKGVAGIVQQYAFYYDLCMN